MLSFGPRPIGALVGGLLAQHVGMQPVLILSVIGSAVFGYLALWPIRSLRTPPAIPFGHG